MTMANDAVLRCPKCATAFTSHVLLSYGQMGADTDFRPHYTGAVPLVHFVHECPHCGFTAHHDQFEAVDGEVERLPRDPFGPPIERPVRAALTLQEPGAPSEEVAWAFLHAAWMARFEGAREAEHDLMRKASGYFEAAIAADEIGEQDRAEATYLVAELHRRTENFDAALRWFAEARDLLQDDPASDLREVIDRQKQMAEARDSSNAVIPEAPAESKTASGCLAVLIPLLPAIGEVCRSWKVFTMIWRIS